MKNKKRIRPSGPPSVNYDLFGEMVPPPLVGGKKGRPKTNPLIPTYGPGPADTKCGSCVHHYFKSFARDYPKCRIRGDKGESTDHSSRYESCGKYEPKAKPAK